MARELRKILYVEDEEDIRMVLTADRRGLGEQGDPPRALLDLLKCRRRTEAGAAGDIIRLCGIHRAQIRGGRSSEIARARLRPRQNHEGAVAESRAVDIDVAGRCRCLVEPAQGERGVRDQNLGEA